MLCAQVLRSTSPPLAAMTAQETALAGAFRAAHQRLVASAEEVAVSGGLYWPAQVDAAVCWAGVERQALSLVC